MPSHPSHRTRPPRRTRARRALVAAATLGFALGLTAPALASSSGRAELPASIGPGVNQHHAKPASVTDALRCARPAHYVHFKRHRAITAVAVGMAESYCEPHAKGKDAPTKGCPKGSVDRGLWQINSCYHPEVSRHCAFKPNCNARAAKHISDHGKDWSPWAAYNSGAYRQYLDVAKQAVAQVWGHR